MKTYDIQKSKILLVDDKVQNLILLKTMIEPLELDVFIATSAEIAVERINENNFDLVLLDTHIHGSNGYEVCTKIKNSDKQNDLSVIFLSAQQSNKDKIKGFKCGADDYLVKPLYQPEVIARLKLHLNKNRMLKQLKQLLRHSYHELYNPLAVIETSAQLYSMHNKQNKYVDAMHGAARSLHLVYEDLFYSISSNKVKPTTEHLDFTQFLNARISFFQLLAEVKGITFDINISDKVSVFIPSFDLQRIIDNTLSNAIKYAFENSMINITLFHKNGIILSISNEGNNIKDSQLIFTQGYREAYEQNGMGIGLEIVSSICNHYNIDTTVTSKDNKTTFTYTFSNEE